MKNELRYNERLALKAFLSLLRCAIIFKLDNALTFFMVSFAKILNKWRERLIVLSSG